MSEARGVCMHSYSRGKIGVIACEGGKPIASKIVQKLEELIKKEESEMTSTLDGLKEMSTKFWSLSKGKDVPEYAKVIQLQIDALTKITNMGYERPSEIFLPTKETWFSNGEVKTELLKSLRNEDIYIIQDVANSQVFYEPPKGKEIKNMHISDNKRRLDVNDHSMALFVTIDAVRRADAHYITAVVPYFAYARQDRMKKRESISAKLYTDFLEVCRANRVMAMDIHNETISGFFKEASFENLRGSKCLVDYIQENIETENMVVVAPDEGAIGRNSFYANILQTKLRVFWKERDYTTPNSIDSLELLGSVKGKNALVVDDMIDTAGTMKKVARRLKDGGAKDILLVTSLPVFSGQALDNLSEAYDSGLIKMVIGTDAVYHGDSTKFMNMFPWYREVSVADYFAQAIYNVNKGLSIKGLISHEKM